MSSQHKYREEEVEEREDGGKREKRRREGGREGERAVGRERSEPVTDAPTDRQTNHVARGVVDGDTIWG